MEPVVVWVYLHRESVADATDLGKPLSSLPMESSLERGRSRRRTYFMSIEAETTSGPSDGVGREEDDLNDEHASCRLKLDLVIGSGLQRKKLRKRVGLSSFLVQGDSLEPRLQSPIVDIKQDENPDSSIVHLHHDPPSVTSQRNKENREKHSQRLTSVGRMVRRSKESAQEETWWGAVEIDRQVEQQCHFRGH